MKKVRQVMLRFSESEHELLRNSAFSARLPVAVFVKEIVLGRVPKPAPPLTSQLSEAAQKLLQILQNLTSNLAQLDRFAAATPALQRLAGEGGLLQALSDRARGIGMQIKIGELENEIATLLSTISGPALALNSEIARPINQSQAVPLETWKAVLQQLKDVLLDSKQGAAS